MTPVSCRVALIQCIDTLLYAHIPRFSMECTRKTQIEGHGYKDNKSKSKY